MKVQIKPQKPKQEFFDLLDQIINNENNTKDCFNKAVQIAQEAGFTDTEIANFMRDYCKDKIPRTTLWRWTKPLVPTEKNDDKNDKEQSDSQGGFIPNDEEIPEDKVWKPKDDGTPPPLDSPSPPVHEDVTKHPDYQRLQTNYDLKVQETNEWKKKAEDLGEIEKKRAFKQADEIEAETFHLTVGMDIQHFKYVKLERVLPDVVTKLRISGWKQAEFWARVIRE